MVRNHDKIRLTRTEFHSLISRLDIRTTTQLARLLNVSEIVARKWWNGAEPAPHHTRLLLETWIEFSGSMAFAVKRGHELDKPRTPPVGDPRVGEPCGGVRPSDPAR